MPYVDSAGVSIHYHVEGDGPPLVLQHGLTSSLQNWYAYGFVEELAKDYRLIMVDARGHGRSGKPHDPKDYDLKLRVNDVLAVMDDLGVDKAHYMGYSMGGRIVVRYEIVSDEKAVIAERMAQWADSPDVDLVVSTGGTGLGPRDVTPEACLSILDKEVPGLAEAMRAETLKFTAMAMLSRSVTGIRGSTLIITLPGSPKGVRETLAVVKPVLPHAIELLKKESVSEHPR